MIEQELHESSTTRAEQKRTNLIASLYQDENLEARKIEENKKD